MALHFVGWFFGGAFLANAIPHLAMGTTGRRFPTPFASPPGKGKSSAPVNVVWGFANLIAGMALTPGDGVFSAPVLTAGCGFLAMALFVAMHFGRIES
jgi:hypothetical protein